MKVTKGFKYVCLNCGSENVTVGNYSRYNGEEYGIYFQCDECKNREEWGYD